MRLMTISVLTAALAAGACNRAETTAAAATASNGEKPAATTGSADAKTAADGVVREVTIPAGTRIPITLDSTVGSDISHVEQRVAAHVSHAVVVGGRTVLPVGTEIGGVVTDATRSGKVKGRAHVAVRLDSLTERDGEKYRIDTSAVGRTAPGTKKKDALEIGAPAAGGAIIGAIAGGKKGAAIGTAIGAGAGTAVVLSTRGQEVHLAKGAPLTLRLNEPVTLKVRS